GWTSNRKKHIFSLIPLQFLTKISYNKQLDDFIKKSQLQTNSPNHPYLEWIPFDCIEVNDDDDGYLYGLPTYRYTPVKLIPLEITDETHDLYYAEVNYLLMRCVMFIE